MGLSENKLNDLSLLNKKIGFGIWSGCSVPELYEQDLRYYLFLKKKATGWLKIAFELHFESLLK